MRFDQPEAEQKRFNETGKPRSDYEKESSDDHHHGGARHCRAHRRSLLTMTTAARLLLVFVLMFCGLTLRSAQPARILIAGKVVDSAGKPIAGAAVEGYGAAGFDITPLPRLTTGPDGAFSFETSAEETTILGRKSGLAPAWAQYRNLAGDRTNEQLVLAPPAPVEGRVTDETGKPVANAEVWVSAACMARREGSRTYYDYLNGKQAQELFSTRTSTDGRFRFELFPAAASADLAVRAPGRFLRPLERESVDPDIMRCRSGQQDVELVVEPAGSIEGKIVAEGTGQPIPGAGFRIEPNRPPEIFHLRRPEPARSGPDGSFRLSGLAAGEYTLWTDFGTNRVPEWAAKSVAVSVKAGQTNRGVTVTASRAGWLEVSVLRSQDRKPAAEVNLRIDAEHYSTSATTDAGGAAQVRLPPGEYHVSALLGEARSEPTTCAVEAGKTNRLELALSPPPKITGVVRDTAGAPAPGVKVTLHGSAVLLGLDDNLSQSDATGRFELPWSPATRSSGRDPCLVARDAARNLVSLQILDEGFTNIELRLQPGRAIAGSVQDPTGKPLTNATVDVQIRLGDRGIHFDAVPPQTDARGRFQISGLPADYRYYLLICAKGYGSTNLNIEADSETNRLEFEPLVLRPANLKIAGQVLDADAKPAARAWVNTFGPGQPDNAGRTDDLGRFAFEACEGRVQVFGGLQSSSGSAIAMAGDTNVIVQLGQIQAGARPVAAAAPRATLMGKPLPDLIPLGLAATDVPADQPVIVLLIDAEQRPSRRTLKLLADQANALKLKHAAAVILQAGSMDDAAYATWLAESPLPFPVARLKDTSEKGWSSWGAASLPWLILADKNHRVVAEGFLVEELEAKLNELAK